MSRFSPLFSSSSGNSMFFGCGQGGILIDCGVTAKRLTLALEKIEVSPEFIKGIFVTHEHSDHVKGLRVFASRHNIPVYGTYGTICALENSGIINGKFPVNVIDEKGVETAGMEIKLFHTSHDSAESCGYTVKLPDGRKAAVCTDLGVMTPQVENSITGSDLIVIESNHDVSMLQNGPYPYILKRRILSDKGHLSNDVCSKAVTRLIESGTTRFILGHLSKENNFPDLAFQTTACALAEKGAQIGRDCIVKVAAPECCEKAMIF